MHDRTTEIIFGLMAAATALAWLAGKLKIPYPIFLVVGGLGMSFIHGLPRVQLRPELVFFIFLPPLLYHAAMLTSWRDFKNNIRPISLLAVGLVLVTMCVIAVVAHAWIEVLTWPAAFALGAIISPPDAIAATAITQRLHVPKRIVTILEGESLINDATAIVAYKFAIESALTGQFSLTGAELHFCVVAIGGVAIGFIVAWVIAKTRSLVDDEAIEIAVSILTPYIAYLPAEYLGVSGVLAVVTAGVYMSRKIPEIATSRARLRMYGTWDTFVFILNGLIFILIGLQLPVILDSLSNYSTKMLISYALGISLLAVLVRLIWVFPAAYLPGVFPKAKKHKHVETRPPWQNIFFVAWTGMRGIVSLAAAMALPVTLKDGTPFPGRHLIIFLTFGVIVFTLVFQGLTLPLVIRALKLKSDSDEDREEAIARLESAHAALSRLEVLAFTNQEAAEAIVRVRMPYQDRVRAITRRVSDLGEEYQQALALGHTMDDVQREALAAERRMIIKLRDEGVIGDDILRRLQTEIDLEEAKLVR